MMDISDFMRQMGGGSMLRMMGLGGDAVGFGNLALIVIMSAIAILRPQQIVRLSSFRRAFKFVGVAVILVPLANLLFGLTGSAIGGISSGGSGTYVIVLLVLNHLPALMTGLAIMSLAEAIIPSFIPPQKTTSRSAGPDQEAPPRHSPGVLPGTYEDRTVPEGLP